LAQADRRPRAKARQGLDLGLFHHLSGASESSYSTRRLIAQETDKVLSNKDKELANRAKVMTDAFYAQNLLREAFPESRYGSVKGAIFAAYRFVRPKVSKELTPRRIRSIREGTARRIDAEEMEALKAAIIEEAHREQQELRARLAALDKKVAAFSESVAGRTVAGAGE